jgi:hypothetical protein
MNRVVALGIVGWIAFAGLGGCQGPDPFDRSAGMTASGGHVNGNGGHIVVGIGGSGAGGLRGSGGAGVGGSGTGGRGGGGGSMGGRGMGGMGAGGMGTDGGVGMGGRGVGGSGVGGRIVDGGANCISTIQMNNYTSGAVSCAGCLDHSTSIGPQCMMMIDCLGASYPCTGNCYTMCFNKVGGSNPLADCMTSFNISSSGCGP